MGARRPPLRAFRVSATGLARRTLLGRVAELVASSPPGTTALVEARVDRDSVHVLVQDSGLAAALEPLHAEFPREFAEVRVVPAASPVFDAGRELYGSLRWSPLPGEPSLPVSGLANQRGGGSRDPGVEGRLLVASPLSFGPRGWMGVQSHWVSAGGSGVVAPTRFRLAVSSAAATAGAIWANHAIAAEVPRPPGFEPSVEWGRGRGSARRWRKGRLSRREVRQAAWFPTHRVSGLVDLVAPSTFPSEEHLRRHLIVLGASGSGKTAFLARVAADQARQGVPVAVIDLHGDLAPAVASRWTPPPARPLLGFDPSDDGPPTAGFAVLDGEAAAGEREEAFVVATLKRLSSDGSEVYWGFRLERIFQTFVRAVREEGGTLLDLFELLTDPRRREGARLATHTPAVAQFLDELPAIVRRNPEFLWPAAARLARLALSPRLARLLSPPAGEGVPLASLLRSGRSVAIRLPIGELGPEASGFVASLVVSRLYLDLSRPVSGVRKPVLLVIDEAQALSPRLLSEMLSEGRKFGVAAVLATQYPDRLAPELRQAAAGAAGSHLVFRVPAPSTRIAAGWAGLTAADAEVVLPQLPDGWAVRPTAGRVGHPTLHVEPPFPRRGPGEAWIACRLAAHRAFPGPVEPATSDRADPTDDEVLLALYGAGRPQPVATLLHSSSARATGAPDRWMERLPLLERRGLLHLGDAGYSITPAGARFLGATSEHGSAVESAEHRQLLLEAFRIFAARGERLELVRQGRFDTRLPDGRLELLPSPRGATIPAAWTAIVDRRRASWAWRYFGGRNVHVEAEVSGADRLERIRRDWKKAERAGAFALFLVATTGRARRLRERLRRLGIPRDRTAVWTLRRAAVHQALDPTDGR